jgi:hypothetical protein
VNPSLRGSRAWHRLATALALVALLSGCASVYVDGAVKEVPASQMSKPAKAMPVQVFFEFQTKGVANAQATSLLKAKVLDQINQSGLFASLVEQPGAGSGQLSITLNNVPMSDDAFSKGFVTGLTFGLAGSQVSDGYVCTAKYTPGNGAPAVTKSARHAIHTTVGNAAAPGNATKAASMEEAAYTMTRQVLSQVLNDLSKDPSFNR